ncbi:MAG: molybdenum ABC transporter ATP-binding protein [Gammaproteobacteria bacterium]|nr:molybdenum ABC transporter ATP-binding protein [Gammaproteobacteria bacterium]MDE2249944.1 molybdenum ABC transporter ATP-binding protein [Gammaproteobacteria bacterium]
MLNARLQLRRGEFTIDARFNAPAPGITALFGRSGAGKSTLMHLLAGLTRPDAGAIGLDGECFYDSERGIDVPAQARGIGYVFQDLRLFPHLGVGGNLEYGLRRASRRRGARLEFARVVALLGLEALLARRTWQLSGGERQRVALGRALLAQPRLLLLDEPLSAIDAARRHELLPYFERLRDELALPMILVTHRFDDVVRLATHVVLLEAGRVLGQGDLPSVSLRSEMRGLLGPDGIGAVVEGCVDSVDAGAGLASVRVGTGRLLVPSEGLRTGEVLRMQLLARDLILATAPPQGLSVRNQLHAVVTGLQREPHHHVLVSVDAGGAALLARVTEAAARELQLRERQEIWVLVKAVSLRSQQQ